MNASQAIGMAIESCLFRSVNPFFSSSDGAGCGGVHALLAHHDATRRLPTWIVVVVSTMVGLIGCKDEESKETVESLERHNDCYQVFIGRWNFSSSSTYPTSRKSLPRVEAVIAHGDGRSPGHSTKDLSSTPTMRQPYRAADD